MANILIVDDSRTSRKMLRTILEEMGHTIIAEAVDGEEGFLKYKELKPDLVTLDITMPKLDGLETLQLIMKEDENAKVVMVSAAGQKEKVIKAIKCGASEFIFKPLDIDDVEAVVNEVFREN